MANKKGRHRKGGRTTPKGTRPDGFRPRQHHADPMWGSVPDPAMGDAEPDLLDEVRAALADDHPLALLSLASSLLAALDPRGTDPFDRQARDEMPARADLINALCAADAPEVTGLLAGIAALSTDDVERRRIERIVEASHDELPAWLEALPKAEAHRTAEMTHVLGDGDNVLIGARLPTGHELTAIVYIDHNLGQVAKDGFLIPDPIGTVLDLYRGINDDPNSTFTDLAPADARARIVAAIAVGAMSVPRFESESWPACRPLIEWMTGLLPDGGQGYQRPEWSDGDRQALIDRFFASDFGIPLDDADHRELLGTILWFGCDYGPGDPLRWSPTSVEIILGDWLPRKVAAEVEHLAKAPAVLRAFVAYCHAERAIPTELTADTLAVLDALEPHYQQLIRSDGPGDPAALLAALGDLDPDRMWDRAFDDGGELDPSTLVGIAMVPYLEEIVGGSAALAALDDRPLPDEPFDHAGIGEDARARVDEVLTMVDRCCDALLDVEHRTASRRLLARIGVEAPKALGRGRADTAAAAICWVICQTNDTFDQRRGGLTRKALGEHFGLKGGGSLGSRATTLLTAAGIPHDDVDGIVGSTDFLVSRRRRDLLDWLDDLVPSPAVPPAPPSPDPGSSRSTPARSRAGRVPDSTSGSGTTVHQLRIDIAGIRPPIWRRLLVPSTVTLADLHQIIQRAFGWWDSHLHEFEIGDDRFGPPADQGWGASKWADPVLDETRVPLTEVAAAGTTFTYTYDFGDDWTHLITVEAVVAAEPDTTYPRCVAGKRAGPIEDSGGPYGYTGLLQVLADPRHSEHEEMLEWVGGHYDPEAFYLDQVNATLTPWR